MQKPYKLRTIARRRRRNRLLLLSACVLFVLAITANTLGSFTTTLPTWHSLQQELAGYFEEVGPAVSYVDGDVTVHFIDVGQGSCVLIKAGDQAVLLDAGETDQGGKIVRYLEAQGVSRLNYVVASHPHSDHIGGMSMVFNKIPTDYVIMPNIKDEFIPTTRVYEDFLTTIQQQKIAVISANMGQRYAVGAGQMTILQPQGDFQDLNDMSIGVLFRYDKTAFLYTADMETQAEKALLQTNQNIQADVFALGHHGSKTSSTEALLDRIGAAYYVVQSGYQNKYGHPHKEAVERVSRRGGTLYRNDLEGTIVFASDGKQLSVHTEKERK